MSADVFYSTHTTNRRPAAFARALLLWW